MDKGSSQAATGRDALLADIVEILKNMTSEWDVSLDGPMGAETKLIADLGFESIDVVQFIVAIQEKYKRRDLPFEQLVMVDGRYVDEITVSDTVAFLQRHMNPS